MLGKATYQSTLFNQPHPHQGCNGQHLLQGAEMLPEPSLEPWASLFTLSFSSAHLAYTGQLELAIPGLTLGAR